MADELHISISGIDEINDVVKALAEADRSLPKQFIRDIAEIAQGMAAEARARALALPAKGTSGTTGLRKDVARGVRVRTVVNRVSITTSMPETDEAIIPRGFDTRRGWRHPVFGNKSNWVRQPGGEFSWFMEAMQDGKDPMTDKLTEALEDAAERIAAAGLG